MSKISSSPDRNTFQKNNYLERCKEEGKVPDQNYLDMWDRWNRVDEYNLKNPEWQKNNMEYDMRSTDWFVEKVRKSDSYAQNLYAAICNNEFQKLDIIPILKEETWGCSWRSAGGVVADLRGEGDYIDWYCSGIGDKEKGYGLTGVDGEDYVSEGIVTDEIREDLKRLGWAAIPVDDE
jgi:hypothetical protein